MRTRPRPSHKQQTLSALTNRLRRQSRKITGPRTAILEILRKHPHPLTNREILAAMPKGECDLATIYRAMHLLEEMGMVKQFDFGDGIARFELIGEVNDAHHHHLVCTRCAEVWSFSAFVRIARNANEAVALSTPCESPLGYNENFKFVCSSYRRSGDAGDGM